MIDHLVYGVPDLAEAVDVLARQTGVRPRFGGQHPGRGTHNALLSLGDRQYLEIIARDPEQPRPADLSFPELNGLTAPALIAWATAVESIAAVGDRVRAVGLRAIGPLQGSRATTDGRLLRWQTLRIADPPVALLPFFISWDAATMHPASDAPSGCTLSAVTFTHPEPETLRHLLAALGLGATIVPGPRAQLTAGLQTPNGNIALA